MSTKQLASAPKTYVDARKFLGNINRRGFAGQIRLAENKLQKLAESTGKSLRLVSHFGDSIYFEDTGNNSYYQASLKKSNRSIFIDDIKKVVVEDNEKGKIFDEACRSLIDAIEESIESGDNSKTNSAFNKIAMGYCSPNVIPESGRVRTWDGNLHTVSVENSVIPEEIRPEVVNVLKEACASSSVTINEGKITIGEEKVDLPINETIRRVSVARNMKTVAENAYQSENFNKLMKTVAGHVSNDSLKDAISIFKSFLTEEQEFTLLNREGVYNLVENTLYRQGIFNYHVIKNVSSLMWETNCHLNKKDILKEWSTAASSCGNKELSENVEILKESAEKSPMAFSDAFDSFLTQVFMEDNSSRAIKAQAYLNMLKLLANVVEGSDADQMVKDSVEDLIIKLENDIDGIDDATLYEVEDLLATVSTDLINDTATLADFDTVPEPFAADNFGAEEDMVGDFEGDMGEEEEDGIGGLGGDLGGEDVDVDVDIEGGEGEEEEEVGVEGDLDEVDLQLDDIIKKNKPINEMTSDDVKLVVEALKGIKPEKVEVDGEFKKMLKKGLTESQVSFVRKVMNHSKTIDNDLFENIASLYYDLVISESNKSDDNSDLYDFGGNGSIEVNEDYSGIKEKKESGVNKAGKDEAGVEGAEKDGLEAASLDGDDSVKEGFEKNLEGEEEGDLDGDYDDNEEIDESIAVVSSDNDEELLDLIDKVLGVDTGEEDGDEEVIIDSEDEDEDDKDPHAVALGNKDDDEQDTAGPEDHEDPHAVALANKDDDNEWSDDADPDQDGKPIWKDKDDQEMKEDNNITDPDNNEYSSETAAEKFGDGSKINKKPTFSDKDYDGTSGAKTGKDKPSSGHPKA